jgi:hypothetical protein
LLLWIICLSHQSPSGRDGGNFVVRFLAGFFAALFLAWLFFPEPSSATATYSGISIVKSIHELVNPGFESEGFPMLRLRSL